MKIINPFNLLMWVIIWFVTLYYLRDWPTVGAGRVGWCSEEGGHAVAYCVAGKMFLVSNGVDAVAISDGSITSWFHAPSVYYGLLHHVVGRYLVEEKGLEDAYDDN